MKPEKKMARYIRDIELHIEEAEVKCEIEWLFRQMNFYQTTWKCEECFCANYKQYGITTMKKHLKELYFFTYVYKEGVLHFEAWIREGKKAERGLTDFNTLRITKPYLDNIVELENRLLNKLSEESQLYQKNQVFLDTERKIYEHNEKWFHIIGISAIILLLLVGCLSFATLKASRVEEDSDTKVQESIGEKTKEKIVTDRPDILLEEDSKDEKEAIEEEPAEEKLNKESLNTDSLESIVKSSEWKTYQSVDDYGENGQKAYETDFMQSDGKSYNNGIRFALIDVLYDYGQTINKNLLSDYWFMERVIPIGNDYYNVAISQEAENIKINLLLNPEEQEYIVLYAICEGGDRVTYNEKEYFSQKEWVKYPYEYEGDISVVIDNPFLEILEISTHTNVESALKTYLETNEYAEQWTIEEIYGYYSLVDYLLVSENSVVWLCLDMSRNEFATETFVWEQDAIEEKEGKIRNPVPTQWQEEDIAYDPDDTIYHKTYYDDFVRGKIMGINYYPDINIREELKDYFLSEQDIERLDSLVEMFYDNRTIEMPEADLQELFQEQGYDIYFHSAEQGDMNVRFVEIMERDGLSLFPIRVLIQTWNESSIYLQDITGPIQRKIRGLIAMKDKDTCKLIVHSSGVSEEFVAEEEISFWEYKGTYWVLAPLETEIDTNHTHNMGDMYPDLDRDKLFQATYYRDGIVYQPSIQNDGVNMCTFRLGKLEEVEKNKSFRLVAVCEVEGQTVEKEKCYIQYEVK